jgi:glycine/D-amino acid oxidase-like deaminating enzyme
MPAVRDVEIVVIGAGVAGIATAYYLCTQFGKRSVLIIDSRQPMSFTSAQSGDNYRNWCGAHCIRDIKRIENDTQRICRGVA